MNYQSSAIKGIIIIVSPPIHDFLLDRIDLILLVNRLKYNYSYCTLPRLRNFYNLMVKGALTSSLQRVIVMCFHDNISWCIICADFQPHVVRVVETL